MRHDGRSNLVDRIPRRSPGRWIGPVQALVEHGTVRTIPVQQMYVRWKPVFPADLDRLVRVHEEGPPREGRTLAGIRRVAIAPHCGWSGKTQILRGFFGKDPIDGRTTTAGRKDEAWVERPRHLEVGVWRICVRRPTEKHGPCRRQHCASHQRCRAFQELAATGTADVRICFIIVMALLVGETGNNFHDDCSSFPLFQVIFLSSLLVEQSQLK